MQIKTMEVFTVARIEKIKKSARGKDLKCSKCGKPINVGDEYFKATPYKRPPIIRCTTCGLKSYKTSGSEYIRECGSLVEGWQDSFSPDIGGVSEIVSALEDLRDQCQESLDNMPENLQQGDTGQMLQDRIDNLEAVIEELNQIDEDTCRDEAEEEVIANMGENYDPDDTYESEEDWKKCFDEEMDDQTENKFIEKIDEALGQLEY